ncbi:MAG: ureidoglycolate dehydrogenase [Planctomycetota bacterium]|jgi:ureidoglycolate dehydrogenase (NAD+)|nr:ureidoglycolate dehydrogenase [Planctomycetota bacterium]
MRVDKKTLHRLISDKLHKAGLSREHADIVADVLVHADLRGVHSHGAMRVEYYSERIAKGGTNAKPDFKYERTGPASAIFDGDNAAGQVVAKIGMDYAIDIAKESGVSVVGMRRMGHSGALSYFVEQAANAGFLGLSVCQSDPMAVPYGGAEPFFGTHPIAFASPSAEGRHVLVDLAVTVQAWGKILHARSRKEQIPAGWAVDRDGNPTTDPFRVAALNHIAGPKGYALAMMVDILSGVLLGLPFGKDVTSMYNDLTEKRMLGQLHIVIDPARFTDREAFLGNITRLMADLNAVKPATGFDRVRYPGEGSLLRRRAYEKDGIEIVDEIYKYLVSGVIHRDKYDNKGAFAV